MILEISYIAGTIYFSVKFIPNLYKMGHVNLTLIVILYLILTFAIFYSIAIKTLKKALIEK